MGSSKTDSQQDLNDKEDEAEYCEHMHLWVGDFGVLLSNNSSLIMTMTQRSAESLTHNSHVREPGESPEKSVFKAVRTDKH